MLPALWLTVSCAFIGKGALKNAGFDEEPSSEQAVPGWMIELGARNGAATPESKVELDEREKAGGRASLHLSGDEGTRAWMLLKQPIPVRPGGRYQLEFEAKTAGVRPNGFGLDNCYVGLFFFDGDGKLAGRKLAWPRRPDQKWRKESVQIEASPAARTGFVYVFLSMIGDLWVDELSLAIEGGEKLPEPEQEWSEDFAKLRRVPAGWRRACGASNPGPAVESVVEIDRQTGALSIDGHAATTRWTILGPEFEAGPGELWTLSGRVRAENVRREAEQLANLHLSLAFLDGRGEPIGDARFGDAGAGSFDWKPVSASGVTPEGTRRVWARAFLSMSGRASFDDLVLTRLKGVPLPYVDWKTVETDSIVLRYAPEHPQADTMGAHARDLEATKAEICRRLEVEFDGPITVFVYEDLDQGKLLTGAALDFADPAGREVHQRRESRIGHEMVHVIAHAKLTYAGTGLLGEGIAVWLDGQPPDAHHRRAAELLGEGELPAMGDLLARFRDHSAGYPAAGSFCGHLLDELGLEVFKALYPLEDPSTRARELTGRSFQDLEASWHELLRKYR